ncbi:MAG: UPF0280 family protein [Pseudomonadota bacterium]
MRPRLQKERTYRRMMHSASLVAFRVVVRETDLLIQAPRDVSVPARESVVRHRGYIESYIARHPAFATTLVPWRDPSPQPAILRRMIAAGEAAGVGPMAAVAGALAEAVGTDLLTMVDAVIVENGGDVFFAVPQEVTAAIYAGDSPLSMHVGVRIAPGGGPLALCTSSGTIGHSLSLGKADAVCVLSKDCALADAAATAVGNTIGHAGDIRQALTAGRDIRGVAGIVAIVGPEMGACGEITLVRIEGKRVAF